MAFNADTLTFIVHLVNFPEWAIPMTKVVPIFYVDDAWTVTANDCFGELQYWWKKIDDTTWDIYIELYGSVTVEGHVANDDLIPLYVDVNLVIVNENIYQEVDTDKS